MNRQKLFSLLLLGLIIFTGCSPEGKLTDADILEGSGEFGALIKPIFNGDPPDSAEHAAVVGLHQLTKDQSAVYISPFCSGTLITSDIVLTAAHCLNVSKNPLKARTMSPAYLAIYVGDDPASDILDHLYLVSETFMHVNYDPINLLNDIALVRLAVPINENVTPVEPLPLAIGFTEADVGGLLNFSGFGQTEYGDSGVKFQVDVPLGSLGCNITGCPTSGDYYTQIAYEQGVGGPCFGDSGGPAFVYRDLVPYVGGITSYGDRECLVYGVSTRVDAYESWIADFVNPLPTLDCLEDGICNLDCTEGEDPDCTEVPPSEGCGDGVCDSGESCDGRYDTISCPNDCPGKTVGTSTKHFCFIGDICEGLACP